MFKVIIQQIAVILTLVLLIGCVSKKVHTDKFSFYPENPGTGDEITVMYLSDSTNLAGAESIEMIVHLFNNELQSTVGIEMTRESNGWKAKFRSSETSFGVLLKFKSGDKLDNNNKAGYFINFYKGTNEFVPGTLAGSAVAFSSWGAFYAELERNRERALELFQEEFKNNPELEREFISPYLLNLVTLYPESSDSIYHSLAEKTEKHSDLNEKEINLLITFYGMTKFYDQDKVDIYLEMIKEKFPNGEYVQNDFINKMRTESDPEIRAKMAYDFTAKFPENIFKTLPFDLAVNGFRGAKDFNGAYEYLKTNVHKVNPLRFYYLVSKMLEEKSDFETALKIADLGIEQNRKYLIDKSLEREKFETEHEAEEMKKAALAYSLFAKGKVLNEVKNYVEALISFEEMAEISIRKNPEMNEAYASSLIENEKYEEAMNEIEDFLRAGKHTPPMKEMLKSAYIKTKGSEEGFDEYISEFESLAKDMLIDKLKDEMILRPAPQFTLTDLNGNTVSLSDFIGKSVMIDFWATWCGPCIASFPGLQQTVNKYADDKDVKFLFINSWERVENKKQNAADFMKKNNYTFHVLMDEDNKVITDFKVSGIPTKFIIDKDQNIRFVSIGYQGTPEGLVEELSAMIEMVR
ncbi:MAG: TlpA family protein disulfide reductase [Ignavibacterium sp.]|nr:TlpA family protein disulfide reductase [Ignavibacterium sp.]